MRSWVVAWTVGAVVASAAAASAKEAGAAPSGLTVAVRIRDYASLSARDLAEAEAYATACYRAAGITIVWASEETGSDAASTAMQADAIVVRVVILPRHMSQKKSNEQGLDDSVMGLAMSGATEARARMAFVFYDRIKHAALSHRAPVLRGLGHVIAHEIGHLLLGVNSHSDEGLMRPGWMPAEKHLQTLTPRQVQCVQKRFSAALH